MLVSTPKPRGPWNFPVVGHLPAFRAKPIQFLMGIAREYGDLPYFRLGGFHVYLINHPDLVREVLVTQQSNFIKSRALQRAGYCSGKACSPAKASFTCGSAAWCSPRFIGTGWPHMPR